MASASTRDGCSPTSSEKPPRAADFDLEMTVEPGASSAAASAWAQLRRVVDAQDRRPPRPQGRDASASCFDLAGDADHPGLPARPTDDQRAGVPAGAAGGQRPDRPDLGRHPPGPQVPDELRSAIELPGGRCGRLLEKAEPHAGQPPALGEQPDRVRLEARRVGAVPARRCGPAE